MGTQPALTTSMNMSVSWQVPLDAPATQRRGDWRVVAAGHRRWLVVMSRYLPKLSGTSPGGSAIRDKARLAGRRVKGHHRIVVIRPVDEVRQLAARPNDGLAAALHVVLPYQCPGKDSIPKTDDCPGLLPDNGRVTNLARNLTDTTRVRI
jgi:hypothetical protein